MASPTGYFSIDTLAEFLSVATMEHLGRNLSAYGFYDQGVLLNPETNLYYWADTDLQNNLGFFLGVSETAATFQRLQDKRLLDNCITLPKLAVTVTGIISGQTVFQTNALELTRPEDLSNGVFTGEKPEDERVKRNYFVWCYAAGNPFEQQIRTLWTPDRDQKLQTLEARRRTPPFP